MNGPSHTHIFTAWDRTSIRPEQATSCSSALRSFCFIHHGADEADPNKTCEQNGGVPVSPGLDIATHMNIVASAQQCDAALMGGDVAFRSEQGLGSEFWIELRTWTAAGE